MLQVLEELARRFKTSEHFHRDFRSQATKLGTRTFIPTGVRTMTNSTCIYIYIFQHVWCSSGGGKLLGGSRCRHLGQWDARELQPRRRAPRQPGRLVHQWQAKVTRLGPGGSRPEETRDESGHTGIRIGVLWNHRCSWGINVRGFCGLLSPTNVCPHKLLTI